MAEASRYSRLVPGSPYSPGALFSNSSSDGLGLGQDDNDSDDSIPMTTPRGAPVQTKKTTMTAAATRRGYLPTSRRFWADFTMGFADGLTVPFALTAGLSSLGQTDTVVYAGLAEVSAGCISMGIGGYLSARQPLSSSSAAASPSSETLGDDEDDQTTADLEAPPPPPRSDSQEKRDHSAVAVAARYLAPLQLPTDLEQLVMAHLSTQPASTMAAIRNAEAQKREEHEYGYYGKKQSENMDTSDVSDGGDDDDDDYVWPVASGLSVALGYLVGGLLPLWPYFFVERVGDGLRWSFAVCVVALFLFGFIRDFALDSAAADDSNAKRTKSARQLSWHTSRIPWRRLWKSTFEGLQMVILGGIAAIAAVLCVRLFESEKSG